MKDLKRFQELKMSLVGLVEVCVTFNKRGKKGNPIIPYTKHVATKVPDPSEELCFEHC